MSSSSGKAPPPGGARASAYARFIPREELGAFAAWSPGAISGGAAPSAPLRRATDQPRGDKDGADELAAQLRAARQSGYQDGYRDGLVALEAFKQTYASQVTAQLGALTAAYHGGLDALQQQMALAVAAAALGCESSWGAEASPRAGGAEDPGTAE
jgi:flagellar assembly protein FliH